ncbi:MAG: hypothetical protein N3E37_01420 [Candidatus Micrarchaeota archaeon]|nr:hypothetical protein [Candidatus Micrarchaeota archaeon]
MKHELDNEIKNIVSKIVNSQEYLNTKDLAAKTALFKTNFEKELLELDSKLKKDEVELVCVNNKEHKKLIILEKLYYGKCYSCKKICDYVFLPDTEKLILMPSNSFAVLGSLDNYAYISVSEVSAYG